MAADTIYSVPDQYAGKSIKQLGQGGFDPNVYMSGEELARQLGVGYETPLTAGQTFQTNWNDTGHGDYSLLKFFTQTPASEYYANQAQAQMNKAIAPVVGELEASKPITQQLYGQQAEYLKDTSTNVEKRYQALLDSLTGKEQQDIGQVNLATSREFGKRGVPLSSGIYDQALIEKTQPIRQYYGGLTKETGIAREADLMKIAQQLALNPIELNQALNQINQAIATIKTGASKDAITNAMTNFQFSQDLQLRRDSLAQALKIAEMENKNSGLNELQLAQMNYYNAKAKEAGGSAWG